jgi:hypothetical protein
VIQQQQNLLYGNNLDNMSQATNFVVADIAASKQSRSRLAVYIFAPIVVILWSDCNWSMILHQYNLWRNGIAYFPTMLIFRHHLRNITIRLGVMDKESWGYVASPAFEPQLRPIGTNDHLYPSTITRRPQ